MTHDERISSYIDNEFSAEQEQEFLISLAASEGLRRSFRSELVMKKVLHHDEAAMNPPRKLRGAVFASLGLAGAGLGVNKANATQSASRSAFKAIFATKINTLVTVAGLSLSALAGYGVRSIESSDIAVTPASHVMPVPGGTQGMVSPAQNLNQSTASAPSSTLRNDASTPSEKKPVFAVKQSHLHHAAVTAIPATVSGAAGSGTVKMDPPDVSPTH